MKVALIGATGRGGSCILTELVSRGHHVTAIVRHADKAPALAGVTARQGDVLDGDGLTALLSGHDAVISAVQFVPTDSETLIGAVRASGVPRWLVMGGAASLEIAPGKKLIDSPDFPPAYEAEARKAMAFLALLRKETDMDWTFLSPAALIQPGQRTGVFRIGGDTLLVDAQGNSTISFEDYGVAMVDELEKPQHSRKRFSVAY